MNKKVQTNVVKQAIEAERMWKKQLPKLIRDLKKDEIIAIVHDSIIITKKS